VSILEGFHCNAFTCDLYYQSPFSCNS